MRHVAQSEGHSNAVEPVVGKRQQPWGILGRALRKGVKYIEFDPMPTSTVQLSLQIPDTEAGQRLDQALARLLPDYSRSRLKTWIEAGEVLVDGSIRRPRDKVNGGELVTVAGTVTMKLLMNAWPMLMPESFVVSTWA